MKTMNELITEAKEAWHRYMTSKPGQHLRTRLGEYHAAALAVRLKAEAFDDLLEACESALRRSGVKAESRAKWTDADQYTFEKLEAAVAKARGE